MANELGNEKLQAILESQGFILGDLWGIVELLREPLRDGRALEKTSGRLLWSTLHTIADRLSDSTIDFRQLIGEDTRPMFGDVVSAKELSA